MEQYIPKAAVVAEIKKLIRENELYLSENVSDTVRFSKTGAYSVLNDLLHFLDALEVKEVKEESVSKDLEEAISQSFIYHENRGDDFRSDKQIETAYRCGFETCAKYYKELASITKDIEKQTPEVKEVDLKKEIKDYFDNQPIITRSKGIDYQLIPSAEVIAKHFFELGLKAQKGE